MLSTSVVGVGAAGSRCSPGGLRLVLLFNDQARSGSEDAPSIIGEHNRAEIVLLRGRAKHQRSLVCTSVVP